MEQCCVPVVAVLIAALVVGTAFMMADFPPESPMVLIDAAGSLPDGQPVPGLPLEPSAAPELEPSVRMHAISRIFEFLEHC